MIEGTATQAPKPAPRQQARAQPQGRADDQAVARFETLLRHKAKTQAKAEPGEALAATVPASSLPSPAMLKAEFADANEALSGAVQFSAERPAPAPEPAAPAATDQAAVQSRFEEALAQAQRLDHAHARPTATQLLLPADAAVSQAMLSRATADAVLNVTLVPGQTGLTANALDELRRRLAGKGLTIGELRLAEAAEIPAA